MIIDLSERLSPHFQVWELVSSPHQRIDNTPTQDVLERLRNLCVYLEQIRTAFGPLRVTSGYRCPELNKAVEGAGLDNPSAPNASAHMFGCAADLWPLDPRVNVSRMVQWIVASNLDYDQVIDEGAGIGSWCHFGLLRPGFEQLPRREALLMRNGIWSRLR